MINVTYIAAGSDATIPLPFPADLDAWRKLLGGPIDVVDCDDTACPVALVTLFQGGPVVGRHRPNPFAAEFAGVCVHGPVVLVAGVSAVYFLDDQFEGWEGDEPEEARAR